MAKWTEQRTKKLRALWGRVSWAELERELGAKRGSVGRKARQIGLKPRHRRGVKLGRSHDAIRERRTLFPGTVVHPSQSPRLLVDGWQQQKLGPRITKGRWKGMPLYALSLEERASCPRRCKEWLTCYGNNMPQARRHILSADLIDRLAVEIDALARKHPGGFAVRLHVLGDFGSPDNAGLALRYVRFWAQQLRLHEALRVFGYTAHDPDREIGSHILALNYEFPDRARIRFSGTVDDEGFGSIVIANAKESEHVVCPVELDRAKNCGECGLCWTMKRTVEFLRH